MHTLTIVFDEEQTLATIPQISRIETERALLAKVAEFESQGYTHPATFEFHRHLFVTEKQHWTSGFGVQVMSNVFFFEHPLDKDWAQDMVIGYQGYEARYLGVHRIYLGHRPKEFVVGSAEFGPGALCNWLRHFWDTSRGFRTESPTELQAHLQQLFYF